MKIPLITPQRSQVRPNTGTRSPRWLFLVLAVLAPMVLAAPAEASSVKHYLPYPAGETATHTAGPHHSAHVHASVYDAEAHDFVIPSRKVVTSAPGTVIEAERHSQLGHQIIVRHSDGTCTRYAHLSGYSVSRGAKVSQGQRIGTQGNTGNSSGEHLHYTRIDCVTEYSLPVQFVETNWTSKNGASSSSTSTPRSTITRDDPRLYGHPDGWRSFNLCGQTYGCDAKWTSAIPGAARDNYAIWNFGRLNGKYRLECFVPHNNAWATATYEVFDGSRRIGATKMYQGNKYGWTRIGTYNFGSGSHVAKVRVADNSATSWNARIGIDACRLRPV